MKGNDQHRRESENGRRHRLRQQEEQDQQEQQRQRQQRQGGDGDPAGLQLQQQRPEAEGVIEDQARRLAKSIPKFFYRGERTGPFFDYSASEVTFSQF